MAKIYTKTGDKGQTSLLGGTRVSKGELRIDTYGTVDELNSWIGLITDQDIPDPSKKALREIQDRLFTIGSTLATDLARSRVAIPDILDGDIHFLENEIDDMTSELPPLKAFILPGGHAVVSYCHIARCVCRRAERLAVRFAESAPVDEKTIMYLNRLSDYLFTLARFLLRHFRVQAVEWKPRLPEK